ncbi:hypothetical protein VK70_12485 [Paenibacillus durus ATCC 35681]|uniref:Lipoprotein n=3 Tax=Paenibacillus durus TaxID=44251 RepID=A0A0F7CJ54_PAEDU|nr:hypothetical protein VK70_12485 [Paenibacillus durus ATCC 35681]
MMKFLKPVLLTILIIGLSACNSSIGQSTARSPQQTRHVEETPLQTKKENEEKSISEQKQHSWLLAGEEGLDEYVQFLVNLDDPSGKTFIRVDDMIDAMQTKEERIKYRDSQIDVRKITEDGSRIAILRDSHEDHQSVIQIYNLDSGEKENEFELPKDAYYPLVSPDLNKYLYELNKHIYLYDLSNDQTIEENNITIEGLYSGQFSPDGSKFTFTDDQKGIILIDLFKQEKKRLLTDTKIAFVNTWDQENQLIYTVAKNSKKYQGDMYSLKIVNEDNKWLGTYLYSSVLSPDHTKLIYGDSDEIKTYMIDTKSGEKRDISRTLEGTGSWITPLQWLDTGLDYMKYSNRKK